MFVARVYVNGGTRVNGRLYGKLRHIRSTTITSRTINLRESFLSHSDPELSSVVNLSLALSRLVLSYISYVPSSSTKYVFRPSSRYQAYTQLLHLHPFPFCGVHRYQYLTPNSGIGQDPCHGLFFHPLPCLPSDPKCLVQITRPWKHRTEHSVSNHARDLPRKST